MTTPERCYPPQPDLSDLKWTEGPTEVFKAELPGISLEVIQIVGGYSPRYECSLRIHSDGRVACSHDGVLAADSDLAKAAVVTWAGFVQWVTAFRTQELQEELAGCREEAKQVALDRDAHMATFRREHYRLEACEQNLKRSHEALLEAHVARDVAVAELADALHRLEACHHGQMGELHIAQAEAKGLREKLEAAQAELFKVELDLDAIRRVLRPETFKKGELEQARAEGHQDRQESQPESVRKRRYGVSDSVPVIHFSFDGNDPPPVGRHSGQYGFCHTSGGGFDAGDIYKVEGLCWKYWGKAYAEGVSTRCVMFEKYPFKINSGTEPSKGTSSESEPDSKEAAPVSLARELEFERVWMRPTSPEDYEGESPLPLWDCVDDSKTGYHSRMSERLSDGRERIYELELAYRTLLSCQRWVWVLHADIGGIKFRVENEHSNRDMAMAQAEGARLALQQYVRNGADSKKLGLSPGWSADIIPGKFVRKIPVPTCDGTCTYFLSAHGSEGNYQYYVQCEGSDRQSKGFASSLEEVVRIARDLHIRHVHSSLDWELVELDEMSNGEERLVLASRLYQELCRAKRTEQAAVLHKRILTGLGTPSE